MVKLSSTLVGALVATVAVTIPVSALAYISPEQVFGGQSVTLDRTDPTTYQAPPNVREGETVQQAQQQNSAVQRTEAQSTLTPDYAEPVDTYVPPSGESSSLGLFNQTATYERRMDRIADEKTNAPTIIIGSDTTVVDSNGNVLHSGAPLVTSTGPETILAVAAMILASLSTFIYAAVRHHRMRHAV